MLVSAAGLIPIALFYGLVPEKTLTPLLGVSTENVNLVHIMRAVMGLYLGQIVFWFLGAFNSNIKLPAIYGLAVFMLGLAFGRIISIIIDGIPHWVLLLYLFLEITIGVLALTLISKQKPKPHNN